MRLDHLLSRENRVSVLGGTEALMAPRLIAPIVCTPSQVRCTVDPQGEAEIERDLARNTEPAHTRSNSCHSSRVKVRQPAASTVSQTEPAPAGV